MYDYDPAWCAMAAVTPTEGRRFELSTSHAGKNMTFNRFGRGHFTVAGTELSLELYWLDGYGGGLFVPFADHQRGRDLRCRTLSA